jgi:dolichyl-phosphate-mannose-protein mannosyltransferase
MEKLWNQRSALLIVAVVSISVHFAFFGHPSSLVFDEVHFSRFVSAYSTGEYYFDIHPPFGKLLISGFSSLFGAGAIDMAFQINTPFQGGEYLVMRFLPSLSGAIIPLLVFLILYRLGTPLVAALFGGLLACLDNALLVQTRSIFLDGFLISFSLGSFLAYLNFRKNRALPWLVLCGLLAGAAIGIKWTGGTALALPLIWEAVDAWKTRNKDVLWRWLGTSALLTTLALVVYLAAFIVHFTLLDKSGPGDAFHSPAFQKTLDGNPLESAPDVASAGLVEKIVELNLRMFTANRDLTATHSYSSPWFTWPVMARPIFYWNNGDQRIYLTGNPVIWWGTTLAIGLLLVWFFIQKRRHETTTTVLLSAWALNFLPFIFIGRVMFLYHYLPALMYGLILTVYLVSQTERKVLWLSLASGLALVSFLWFAPLSYGLSLDVEGLQARQWFDTWK